MQYRIYRNAGRSDAYPYLLDVQSDIIDELSTRLAIPLFPRDGASNIPKRLCPIVAIEGNDYLVMTHEMAAVRVSLFGDEVMDVASRRGDIKSAIDFLMDGF
jgi:toxin CcdB